MAAAQTVQINGKPVSIPTGLFINNEFVPAKAGGLLPVEDPAIGKTVISVAEGMAEDVDIAVKAARTCFNSPEYRDLKAEQRGALLARLADIMEARAEEIIAVEQLDSGKTRMQVANIDLPASLGNLRYYAGWADKVHGDANFNIPKTFAYTKREPIGVCGQIIPWNFPLLMFIWKIAPALVTGNTVVVKTAESTPLTALKICEFIKEAGFPAGAVNVISGYGKSAGAALAEHMGVDKVAFTGSTATGRTIMRAAANSNLKKVTLELGGKSPNIVFADADLEQSVEWSVFGLDMNQAQTCHAGTRIYVQEEIYDAFMEKFTARLKSLKVGGNFAAGTQQGPQASKIQYDRILNYIDIGKKEGATLALGGNAIKGSEGYFIEPTVFTDVRPDMRIVREEIFGPVVAVAKFKTEEEALALANDSNYGLAAGVHTKDFERAMRVTGGLRAGTVWHNMFNFLHWSLPFGGYKESGIGRECGEAALQNYTELKAVLHNMGVQAPTL
ncbi:hypothetical protein H2204_011260 [Knufia peltigerae]|uniref:aldehyde dehydrogenase (NAD(+)) n=1 Tax=Knufia peltigerae TaxID=1002370 RepID=A0AA38XVH4_9EURO|nr:hypothetical protein H2204_011260 [Knufia peltigerae]